MGYYPYAEKIVDIPASADHIFSIFPKALQKLENIKIEDIEKHKGAIHASTGISFFSWGERIEITISEISPHCCRVTVKSTVKLPPIDVGYAIDIAGRNKANIRDIFEATDLILKKNPYFVPDYKIISIASAQKERIANFKRKENNIAGSKGKEVTDIPFVYICYVPEDNEIAEETCAVLESHGIPCWIAPRDCVSMHNMEFQKSEGIKKCDRMVLIFSSHATMSSEIIEMVAIALSSGLDIIFYCTDNLEIPKELSFLVGSPKMIDARGALRYEGFKCLISTIKFR